MPVKAPKPPDDPYVGRKLDDKFLIEQLLGVGGMGRVYKAVQLSLDKQVCVKVLRTGMGQDETLARRFHREARASSRLNHPNSISIIDFGQAAEDGALYMAMEFIPGKDLGKVIQQEYPLGEERIVAIMDQVLSALADAHAAGIVHRDLKPENIMVTDLRGTKDFVKVLDFGIAKLQESTQDPALTQAGMVCGTPEYMSPEQARGEELDARSDLYAAGVILYQMVSGRLPFTAPTAMGIVTKHLVEPPTPPSQLEGVSVSPAMEACILKAMSKDRAGRQPTALALQQELATIRSQKVAPAQQAPEGQDLFTDAPAAQPAPAQQAQAAPAEAKPAATVIRPEDGKGSTEDVRASRPSTAPAPQPQPAPAPAKGGMGWLVWVLVALIVLGGGGAALYFLVLKKDTGPTGADAGTQPAVDAGVVVAQVDAGAGPDTPEVDAGTQPAPADEAVVVAPPADPTPAPADEPAAPSKPRVSEIARMHYQTGKELMARRKYSKAIPAFRRAIKNSPDFADAYKALGTCFISTGKIDKAKQALRSYLEKKPDAEDRDEIQEMIDSF